MREVEIQQAILLALGARTDLRVWRNNVGVAVGANGRPIRFGVPGSADICGLLAPSGRFLGIEVKAPGGRLRPDQEAWGAMVQRFGGLYVVARSVEDAVRAVDAALKESKDASC